jgi:hypothetical protein
MGGSCGNMIDLDEAITFTKVTKGLPDDDSMHITHISTGYFFSVIVYNRHILYSSYQDGNTFYFNHDHILTATISCIVLMCKTRKAQLLQSS